MGLLRGIARTAAVAGTATAVSNRVSRRQAGRWSSRAQEQQDADPGDEEQAQEPADDMTAQLEQLKQLGELTDAEFERQKALILGDS
jgi:hypothetical protein